MTAPIAQPVQLPIRDSVGAALRFVRENWRFVFSVAAIAAVGQGVILIAGPNLIWMLGLLVAVTGAHTALTSAALDIPRPFISRLGGDMARVAAAMALIGFFLAILFIMIMFVTMSVLIAPYQAEVLAAGEDQVAIQAILERAVAGQPHVTQGAMLVAAVLVFAITTRFYLAAPATIDRKRVTVFESWRMTRGNFLRIAGARLLLLGPAFIFASALQTLLANALGAPIGDPVATLNYGAANPLGFAVFYTASIFLQIVIFSVLEAGLSAKIYRALTPPPA
jgi:hypothetical protein